MLSFIETYLKNLKKSGIDRKIPNISEENAGYIKNLIREKNVKHLLEIGTANGYSAIQFASVIDKGSTITTIEFAWNAHIEAVEHFKNCKIKNIHALWGDSKMILPSLQNEYFDFLYIDAMKREYLDYLLLALPKLTSNAIIVIDDVEKFANKMENLYKYLEEKLIPFRLEKTDIDDSIMILERKNLI